VKEEDMNIDKLASFVLRVTFVAALLLLAIACVERLANSFGYTILPYAPSRMLEFATVFLVAVIALLLRQVRDALRRSPR
jgi:hypothetical protein